MGNCLLVRKDKKDYFTPDFSNIIYSINKSGGGSTEWTVTEPCFVQMDVSYVPEGQVPYYNGSPADISPKSGITFLFCKEGDVVKNIAHANWGVYIYAFGLKKL